MRLVLMVALLVAAPANAQTLNAEQADAIVKGCAAHARAKGQGHAIAVVDLGGHPVAMWRMDGNAFGMMEFSLEKARAVAAWGFATSGMVDAVKGAPGFCRCPSCRPRPRRRADLQRRRPHPARRGRRVGRGADRRCRLRRRRDRGSRAEIGARPLIIVAPSATGRSRCTRKPTPSRGSAGCAPRSSAPTTGSSRPPA